MARILSESLFFKFLKFFDTSDNILFYKIDVQNVFLSFIIKENSNAKEFMKHYTFLEIITTQRPFFIRAKKSITRFKQRRGNPIGVAVTIRNRQKNLFCLRLIGELLPKALLTPLKCCLLSSSFSITTWTFHLTDTFIFSEIKYFYFYFAGMSFINFFLFFKKISHKNYVFYLSRLIKLPYQDNII